MDCVDPDSDLKEVKQEDIYKKEIIEHYKHPHNFGELTVYTHKFEDSNRICGDQVNLTLSVKDNIIQDAKFHGQGCAVSIAAASMFTEKVVGMTLEKVQALTKQDMLDMLGLKALLPSRMKCASLALNALQRGLKESEFAMRKQELKEVSQRIIPSNSA